MKYLVLKSFISFGKHLQKGDTVDASEIRSPTLRQSEGKIIPAVPSFEVPEEKVTEQAPPQDISEGAAYIDGESDAKPAIELSKKPGGAFSLLFKKE